MTDKPKKMIDKKAMCIYCAVFLLILLIYVFCTVALPVILHEHTLVKTEALEPTCEEYGNLEYWTCTDCGKVYEDEDASVRTRTWKRRIETHEHVFFDATCTEAKTCCLCKYAEESPLGHDFEPPQYVWSENMMECTATMVCRRNPYHVETETVKSVLIDDCYIAEFENLSFGISRAYNIDENGYENVYEGEKIPTTVEDNKTFYLEKLETISYPSNDMSAHDFDVVYINGIKYRFVGMSNDTIRIYKENDYENFIEINHVGNHNYVDISPYKIESLGGKVLFTGYRERLDWFVCDMESLTAENSEYENYSLYFDHYTIGMDATPYIDFENNILYWYGYTTHFADASDENKIIITAWDISELDFSNPNESQIKLISQNTIDYLGVIQGGRCYDGDIYMGASNVEYPHESRLLRLDAATGTVKTKLVFEETNVIQGVSYIIEGNNITWYISDYYDLYKVKIER